MAQNKPVIVFTGVNNGVIREMVLLGKCLQDQVTVSFYRSPSFRVESVFHDEKISFPIHFPQKVNSFQIGSEVKFDDKNDAWENIKNKTSRILYYLRRAYWDLRAEKPIKTYKEFKETKRNVWKELKLLSPSLVILHNHHRLESRCIVSYCFKYKIPTLILPSASAMITPEGMANILLSRRSKNCGNPDDPIVNRILAALRPQLVQEYNGRRLIFDSGLHIIIYKLLGLWVGNPWVLGSGHISYLGVSGRDDWNRYIMQQIPREKLIITGLAEYDDLYVRDRNYPSDPSGRLRLTYAIPPLPEHAILSWQDHIKILNEVLECLKKLPVELQLSLHPQHPKEVYEALAEKHGIRVADVKTRDLIPSTDIYLCTYSSTMKFALAALVPTIHLDLYNIIETSRFDFLGLIQAFSMEHLAKAIMDLHNPSFYLDIVNSLKISRKKLLQVDGRATERLAQVVMELLENRRPSLAGIDPE